MRKERNARGGQNYAAGFWYITNLLGDITFFGDIGTGIIASAGDPPSIGHAEQRLLNEFFASQAGTVRGDLGRGGPGSTLHLVIFSQLKACSTCAANYNNLYQSLSDLLPSPNLWTNGDAVQLSYWTSAKQGKSASFGTALYPGNVDSPEDVVQDPNGGFLYTSDGWGV
jgi:hypothetical protein